MALHPVKLPPSARDLRRIVAMQRLLLSALCAEPMSADLIDLRWLQTVWATQDERWIKNFCRKRIFSILEPIQAIANSSSTTRQSLYNEFCRQNRVRQLFTAGGQFVDINNLNGVSPGLATEVHRLFVRFYQFLSHDTNAGWDGYEFQRGRRIKNESYKTAFETSNRPTLSVCPYCDGANDEPELDHYYSKENFPFISCSPWNLVPACHLCNKLSAKANKLALTPNVSQPTANWLHPYFRPASAYTEIRLNGEPQNSVPQLYSPDCYEQIRLNNHSQLIRTLSKRWTKGVINYFEVLVGDVNRKLAKIESTDTIESLVSVRLEDHNENRGRDPLSLLHAAVCKAVLDKRPGYIEEFATPNVPRLD